MKKLAAVIFLILVPCLTYADTPEKKTITVVYSEIKPDIFKKQDRNKLSGFGYDLWEAIAKELNYKTTYKDSGQFSNLFSIIESKQADIGIASITKTEERERSFDFSDTYLESSIAIAVNSDLSFSDRLMTYIKAIFSFKVLIIFCIPIICARVLGLVIYLIERKYPDIPNKFMDKDPQKSGWDVASRAFWESMTTQGTGVAVPRTRLGYFLCYVVGYYLGNIINALFVSAFVGIVISVAWDANSEQIGSFNDLDKLKVATVKGTTSETQLETTNAEIVRLTDINEGYKMLLQKKVKAVVFDKPNILFFAKNEGKGRISVIDGNGEKERYGFIFPQGSPLREEANRILLRLIKDGTYSEIHRKWFGEK
ncbi:MAG: hypothetical protein D6B27_09295 [Gammaproteobacteria bacterium]|nr:MAG: hypothetical protein D6B27_09295 [Gammaproteobacteria bacterium]